VGNQAPLERISPHPRPARARRAHATAGIPRATYRLQLHGDFTFAHAADLAPYLAALGVSHVYSSPTLRARPGSVHGYDIVDHNAFNPELGGRDGFERLVAALRSHGMGLVLDIVPNHMAVMGADNAWWMDVLENGPASVYAGFFDIDWDPLDEALANRVLLPVLGDHYGLVLERGELRLVFEATSGSFAVHYHDHRFPLDPREYPRLLDAAAKRIGEAALAAPVTFELAGVVAAFGRLPARTDTRPESVAKRHRDKEVLKRLLAWLATEHPPIGSAVEEAVRLANGTPGDPASFAELHELLDAQAYRLAFWRVASDEINYRRFFDINDLAALRVEDDGVFDATHALVLQLAAAGDIEGLRVDHPDGLYDPARYFRRLQERYAALIGVAPQPERDGRPARPLWVVAEKIAARHEELPDQWAVQGTTGYRFAAVVNGLFVDGAAKGRLERIWRAFTGEQFDSEEAAYRGKRAIMRAALASELTVLATQLLRLARADRRTRDYTFNTLRQALTEVIACFPVYRTYCVGECSRQDRRYIDWAVARAKRRSRGADPTIYDFLRAVLRGEPPDDAPPGLRERYTSFMMKFQQYTAPVTAKGVEDTAFYVYNPLVSLNEVGADPVMFGFPVSAFHGASADRATRWPHTMLATSTHDNKRSEDVRARIDVLSEMPAAWRLLLRRWRRMNRSKKRTRHDAPAPSRNDEYLLYQTLLGTFPPEPPDAAGLAAYRERIERYMLKAVREAKVHSSWINPDAEYEAAVSGFVTGLLGRADGNLFLDDLRGQAALIAWFGMLNSLAMTLIKFASPGVPDLYQGNEIFDLSLVDPDNRRPVDYALRRRLLDSLATLAGAGGEVLAARVRELFDSPYDGRTKLWIVWRALGLRRADPLLFEQGDYVALEVSGAKAAHVVAFARRHEESVLIAIAGRLFATLLGEAGRLPLGEAVWGDTAVKLGELAENRPLVNALTGECIAPGEGGRLPLAKALASFPGALLRPAA
jgi:(1->4)-alpha-D-glucan 1-alpha-D-glucosylmutase